MKRFCQATIISFLSLLTLATYSQTFTEVSQSAQIQHFHDYSMGGGAAFLDFNNDGYIDIYLSGGTLRDKLYKNDGTNKFIDVTFTAGFGGTVFQNTTGVAIGDINNDGWDDIFVTTWNYDPTLLFLNNGNETFSEISASAGVNDSLWCLDASFGDVNLDGFLDIYVANYVRQSGVIIDQGQVVGFAHKGFKNTLYLNNGDLTFSKMEDAYGIADSGCALAVVLTDFDFDHDVDMHIANDFGEWWIPDALYENNYPNPSFTNISAASNIDTAEIYGMGIAIGDYDEDGDLDYYATNIGRNVLSRNNGDGTFSDVTTFAGTENTHSLGLFATSWGTAFLDYDNDSYLDLFVANGPISAAPFIATGDPDADKLYKNNGNGTFTDVSVMEGVSDSSCARGMAYGDYDGDGDLDLIVTCLNYGIYANSAQVHLYRNDQSNGNNYFIVALQGVSVNRNAYGSRVRISAGGRWFVREIDGGSSHASRNLPDAHFGLGNISSVDTVEIVWIGGKRQYLYNQAVNQKIVVVEDTSANACPRITGLFTNPVTTHSSRLNWQPNRKAHRYQIRGRQVGGTTWLVIDVAEGVASHKDVFGLQNNTEYEWQIKQICDVTNAWVSEWSDADTFSTGCYAPDSSWTEAVSATGAQLAWEPVEGAAGYEIKGRRVGALNWATLLVAGSQNSKTVFGLAPFTTYEWTVRTWCDTSGFPSSNWVPLVQFTTANNLNRFRKSNFELREVNIWPNPAEHFLNVSLPFSSFEIEKCEIVVFGSAGTIFMQQEIHETSTRLDVSELASGVYFVEFRNGEDILRKKVVVH